METNYHDKNCGSNLIFGGEVADTMQQQTGDGITREFNVTFEQNDSLLVRSLCLCKKCVELKHILGMTLVF